MSEQTRQIEHTLGPTWAKHAQEVVGQIANAENQNWILKGKIAHNEREMEMMHKHLGTLISLIVEAEKLPPSITPYALSADGAKLVGAVRVLDIREESEPLEPYRENDD